MFSEAVTKERIEVDSTDVRPVVSSYDIRAEAATSVVTLAFATDPVARWTYPDPDQYLEYFLGLSGHLQESHSSTGQLISRRILRVLRSG